MAKMGRPIKAEKGRWIVCAECGEKFFVDPTGYRKRYCSRDCITASKRRKRAWQKKLDEAEAMRKEEAKSVLEVNNEARASGMNYGDYVAQKYLAEHRIVRKW